MLNDFVAGELGAKRAESIILPLQHLIEVAHENGVPIIFSNDAHYAHDVEVTMKWGQHAMRGTFGAKVISELTPDAVKDFVVEKRTYSGFYETGLDPLLRSLYKGEGVKTLVLCGVHTHMCVRHTAADAFFRGYHIIVASDGVEAFTEQHQKEGLKYIKDVYNAKILTIKEIIKDWQTNNNNNNTTMSVKV
jgi:nicotinamidase-related amidase